MPATATATHAPTATAPTTAPKRRSRRMGGHRGTPTFDTPAPTLADPTAAAADPNAATTDPNADEPTDPGELAAKYKRLAHNVARIYSPHLPAPKDDDGLFGECWATVLRCAQRFDRTKRFRFSTYATRSTHFAAQEFVRRELRRGMTWVGDSPRPDVPADRRPKMPAVVCDSQYEMGSPDIPGAKPATNIELAASTGMPAARANADRRERGVEWTADQWESVLGCLDAREREIVVGVFVRGETLREVGRRVGVSKARVGQLVGKACERIAEACPWLADEL